MNCGRPTRALSLVGFVVFAVGVLAGDTVLAQPPKAADPTPETVRILASGRLLGYFRMPDQQTSGFNRCPTDWGTRNDAVRFLDVLNAERTKPGTTVVVAMGENFSPEFFSRMMHDDNPQLPKDESPWVGKDKFTYDWMAHKWIRDPALVTEAVDETIKEGRGHIEADNVACFFLGAGFDALVPGKHDFYFGPERVRMLARLLATPELGYHGSATRPQAVQMLASNLVIRTSFRNPGKPIPEASKTHLPFVTQNATLRPKSLKDGDIVLPYIRKFQFTATQETPDLHVALRSDKSGDPDALDHDDYELSFVPHPNPKDADEIIVDIAIPRAHELEAGRNYGVCFDGTGVAKKERPYCVRFATDSPFFQFPNATRIKRSESDDGQKYNDPAPFFVAPRETGEAVAVFGVVDPKLREHVGELNTMWSNVTNGQYKTEIALMDPVRALKQTFEYFEYWYGEQQCGKLNGGEYDRCLTGKGKFPGKKVLLAQMRSSEVRELAAQMEGEFNVLISQAEVERATPNELIVFDAPPPPKPWRPSFLFVPRPAYDSKSDPETTNVQVRALALTPLSGKYQYEITGTPQELNSVRYLCDEPRFQETVAKAWNALGLRAVPAGALSLPAARLQRRAQCENAFQLVALSALRQHEKADIALLQRRDFYFAVPKDAPESPWRADLINRILWKGDFVMKILISGSTLKTVLTRGTAFDGQDHDSLSLEVERGRGVVYLGVTVDPDRKEYLVNGAPLEDTRLYTVATSDYLALGDTGYSELSMPVIGHSLLPQDFKFLYPISSVVAHALDGNMDPKPARIAGIEAGEYLDRAVDSPPNITNGLSRADRFFEWFKRNGNTDTFTTKMTGPERLVQNRTVGFVSLQKALISFSDVDNNVAEDDRTKDFAGVSVDQVKAASRTAVSVAIQARTGVTGRLLEFFVSNDLAYSRESIARVPPLRRLQNYLDDHEVVETGLFWRVHGKPFPHFGPQVSFRIETQVARPLELFVLKSLKSKDKAAFDRERSTSLLPRIGFRAENRKSSVGFGYEMAVVQRIDKYTFDTEKGTESCPVEPRNPDMLTDCIKNSDRIDQDSKLSVDQSRLFRNGFYADAKFVGSPTDWLTFTSQWSAELLLHRPSDNLTMTKWRYQGSAEFAFKIFKNLSAQLEGDYFRFLNQFGEQPFGQRKALIGLNYTFDWFSGNPGRVLKYGK